MKGVYPDTYQYGLTFEGSAIWAYTDGTTAPENWNTGISGATGWHHYAFTYNGSSRILYIDGTQRAVGWVAFPALSRIQDDPDRFRSYFLRGYALILGMTVPIIFACSLYADQIIVVLLGPKWTNAAPIFRIMSPTVLAFALINPCGWMLMSLKSAKLGGIEIDGRAVARMVKYLDSARMSTGGGRYAYQPFAVAPSRIQSPISPFAPRELSERGIERQIRAFVRCAALAREAGVSRCCQPSE